MTRMDIIKRIDWIGALLSIGGVTLFLVALQAGGYQYAWTDGRVLGPLIVGLLMILAFPFWELYGAHFPMVPREIFEGQRIVALSLVLSLVAGKSTSSRHVRCRCVLWSLVWNDLLLTATRHEFLFFTELLSSGAWHILRA